MAALSSVNPTRTTDDILPEIVKVPIRTGDTIDEVERNLSNFRNAFDGQIERFTEESFKKFILQNLTVRCSDGQIRFQSCIWKDKQISPLAYLITSFALPLILLQCYPILKDVQSDPGIYPLHLLLKRLEELWFGDDAIEKIKNTFTILVYSQAPLHHDPIEEPIHMSKKTNTIYSPLYYLAKGSKDSPKLCDTLCSTLINLIFEDRVKHNLQQIDSFLPQQMPTSLFPIIHDYLIDPSSHSKPPIRYPNSGLINKPVQNKSLLAIAIECHNMEAVKLLLVLKADPNKPAYYNKELQQKNNHSGSSLELAQRLALSSPQLENQVIKDLLEAASLKMKESGKSKTCVIL